MNVTFITAWMIDLVYVATSPTIKHFDLQQTFCQCNLLIWLWDLVLSLLAGDISLIAHLSKIEIFNYYMHGMNTM